jgi:hypothetical protein
VLRRTPTTGGVREGSPHHNQQIQQDREDEFPAENIRKALVAMQNICLSL